MAGAVRALSQDWGRFPWFAECLRRAFFFRRLFEDMRVSLESDCGWGRASLFREVPGTATHGAGARIPDRAAGTAGTMRCSRPSQARLLQHRAGARKTHSPDLETSWFVPGQVTGPAIPDCMPAHSATSGCGWP